MNGTPSQFEVEEVLRDTPQEVVYRAHDRAGRHVLLKVVPRAAADWHRLANEQRITASLDDRSAVRALALDQYQGNPALVVEDVGGVGLDELLGRPLPVGRFLAIARAAARALGEVHRRGIIHKDLKPENLILDEATGRVRIAGFGIASRAPREHPIARPPVLIEGTLAYMSPEQTGRMNRTLDQRTDLYSLGVTFYELLTATRPFAAPDPLEAIHNQIARTPAPPAEVVPGIPAVLSQIVMKLLAKTAEDRYQTARGLERDLQRCQEDWNTGRSIPPFALAEHDAPDRLHLPQRLYGRQREHAALAAAWDRASAGVAEVVLISGPAGIGKSAFAQHLQERITQRRGVFLAGRFDQYNRGPHAAIAQALGALVKDILVEGGAASRAWRERLERALGDDAEPLIALLPSLEHVLERRPARPEVDPAAARARFGRGLQSLLTTLATPERPIALHLEDLQWADPSSVALLGELLGSASLRHLLVVATYRPEEVDEAKGTTESIARLTSRFGPATQTLALAPFSPADLQALVTDALGWRSGDEAQALAALIHEKTGGNALFATQFLSALEVDGILTFDPDVGVWRVDLERAATRDVHDSVADLMARQLGRLPAAVDRLLGLAACLGIRAEVDVLAAVAEQPADLVDERLSGVSQGLLVRENHGYRFTHPRVRQAAYLRIPEPERPAFHLRVGRELRRRLEKGDQDDGVFSIAGHFNRAWSQITDPEEQRRAIELDLLAGRGAKAAHDYDAALDFLAAGIAAARDDWARLYELLFQLHLERASCHLAAGDLAEAKRILAALIERARTVTDEASAYRLRQYVHLTAGDITAAVDDEIAGLAACGIELPRHPSGEDVGDARLEVDRLLAGRSVEELVSLPDLTDPTLCAALEIHTPSYFADQKLFFLHVARMVALTLRHGLSEGTPYWYGNYGLALAALGEYAGARRLASAGHMLVELRQLRGRAPESLFCLGTVSFWTDPIAEVITLFESAVRVGREAVNLTAAAYSASQLMAALLTCGAPLPSVEDRAAAQLAFLRPARQRDAIDVVTAARQVARRLQGRTKASSSFDDQDFDEAAFEAQLSPERMSSAVSWYWIYKLWMSVVFGEREAARAALETVRPLLWSAAALIPFRAFHLHAGLTAAGDPRDGAVAELRGHHDFLRRCAAINPATFGNAAALLRAELARLEGRPAEAMAAYEEAITGARLSGFVHEEALACELAASFYRTSGAPEIATLVLRAAHAAYVKWGAVAKARQLEQLDPGVLPENVVPTETIVARPEQVDVLSVVRASQALSGELRLDRLIRRLMKIVLTQSGAERGTLIVSEEGRRVVQAEAEVTASGVEVKARRAEVESSRDLPASIIDYVWRVGEPVVLDEATADERFGHDEYVTRRSPRSVLCLQLRHRRQHVGLLYLENNALRGAFPPARVDVLEVLASQAAISLANARYLENERLARATAEGNARRSHLLAQASALVSESLDDGVVLDRLSRLMVRSLADWCVIDLLEGDQLRTVAHAHAAPDKEPLLAELVSRYRSPLAAEVVRTGRPVLIPDVTPATARRLAGSEGHQRLLLRLGVESLVMVPLLARGRVLGVLTCASGRRLGSGDLSICEEIGRRAATALDHAQLYRQTQEAVRVRDEFLSVASHELNTPMAALMLSLQNMTRRDVDAERVVRLAAMAERQGVRLVRLIGELLDLTHLERGTLALQPTQVDLVALVQVVVTSYGPELARAGCEISVDAPPVPSPIVGCWDPSRLEQVVLNLLSNAAKFGRGKPISVQVTAAGEVARISVQDHGIGIDPGEQLHIFERFVRGVPGTHYAGLGLGLFVTREIVHAHGGSIHVESRRGEGAKFTVELPRVRS